MTKEKLLIGVRAGGWNNAQLPTKVAVARLPLFLEFSEFISHQFICE
jgi:hypothetical protein